jgi:hypothetical protein
VLLVLPVDPGDDGRRAPPRYPAAVRGVDVVRRGPERVRVGPWRGDRSTAHLTPMGEAPALSADMVRHCCTLLAIRGYGGW